MRLRPNKFVRVLFVISFIPILLSTLGQRVYQATHGEDERRLFVTFRCTDLSADPPICVPTIIDEPDSVWRSAMFYAWFEERRSSGRKRTRDKLAVENPLTTNPARRCDFLGDVDGFVLSKAGRYPFSCWSYPRLLQDEPWRRYFIFGVGILYIATGIHNRRKAKQRSAED